jgi:hypothetical protein
MAKGNPADLKIAISNTAPIRKVNRTLLSAQVKFLNFNANSDKGETMSHENRTVMLCNVMAPNQASGKMAMSDGNPQIKSAWAGVGTPMNASLCRVSILNLANRMAAKTGNAKPIHDHTPLPEAAKRFFIMTPGSTPKLTMSASESSSLPIGLDTFNRRAVKPSKKSKMQAAHTNQADGISGFVKEQMMPAQPHSRLPDVKALGMWRSIISF